MHRCALLACLLPGLAAAQATAQADSACSAATEARHLRAAGLPDARRGAVLTLPGRSRGQLVLRDDAAAHAAAGAASGAASAAVPGAPAGATQPRFAGRLPHSSLWWLRLCGAAPGQPPLAHALVSADTAEVLAVCAAPPVAAPDGQRVALVEPPDGAQGSVLALWQQRADGWTRAFHYTTPSGLTLHPVRWRGDGAALFLTWTRHDATACSGPVQLRDGPHGWDWVPGLPAGRCP